MGDRRTRNARRWARYVSAFPIWGGAVARGIEQNALSKNQAEEAAQINPVDVTYQESPYAKEQLGLARNAMNARMPGGAQMEGNVFRSQSNTMLNLSRVGTSPQQMAAAAGATQLSTNNALNNLAAQESQYRNSMLGNTNNALAAMTAEHNKTYADSLRKYQRDFDQKQLLLNSSQENAANATQSFGNASTAIANTLLQGLSGGMFAAPTAQAPDMRAQTMGGFNSKSWFTLPTQANFNPTVTPYRP